ncbi:putative secreted hydrolase [Salinibacter ruber]|uniref:lipocalin-like domain-containing protein n=1 Tax=Salinibacter ruber TaxID=146919 RepID=UPI002166D824|nr:lipocalin-like domain-containing protein [Salinibacter ruber]MCS3828584.1 putative secreted hydrolase [Salinibacter ruber]MCS3938444.1 putative secreted hydrolase [Salinibacter ruber]MCS4054873.1 putative secreted hydrolase [Salinibacter ruber]MCS4058128.1 putative secreted hydrolase [Salinibacter ruber]MCS4102089.1 putative secreted hydrolase [Salinibacter ruber]
MTRSVSILAVLAAAVAGLGLGAYWLTASSGEAELQTSVSVSEAMAGDTTGYRRATAPRAFTFPEDYGPHPGYKTEWWYVTGTLSGPDATPYGYELTIFRTGLTPPDEAPDSPPAGWRTNQLYLAHFAVTDGATEEFHAFERFQRGGAGLAGAQSSPFRVWLDDWSMTGPDSSAFPLRLRAQQEGIGIDLALRPTKPRVLQGDQGLSQKGPGGGNASYYYSYTRLATEGTLVLSGDTLSVTGNSWMDREWSTSALGPDQEGWDWFSLQLDDGRDLMYYQLRRTDGTPSRFSEGVIVGPDGATQTLDRSDVSVEVLETWTSPDGTHTYPVDWTLRVPDEDIDLRITPLFPDQELDVSVRYWEGFVRVKGSATGRGYVEMTGYGDSPGSPVS